MNNESSMDQAFLEELTKAVEQNLGKEKFGVKELAHEAGMSRSKIHRKLHSLTGQSTTQFIREIRLQHAHELLRNRVGTVSEISYRVGFGSPSYFSKCFHDYYGVPPVEAVGKNRGDQISAEAPSVRKTTPASGLSLIRRYSLYKGSALIVVVLLLISGYLYKNSLQPPAPSVQESIAVIPLQNLTGNADNNFIIVGLHDALISELGQISSLRVISRTSTLQFKNPGTDITDIAGRLGVDHIIEGSVYSAGDSLRIQLQLIRIYPEERHLWAQAYYRDLSDVLVMLGEVTREVVEEVQVALTPDEEILLTAQRKVNPEAYKAYLRGIYHLNQFTPEGYQRGIDYLLEATRIDPADPLPWARLAQGYNSAGHGAAPPPDAFDKAQAAAQIALNLDETLGEIHLALALVDLYQNWDWTAAEQGFRKTFTYNPNIAEAYANHSWFMMMKGDDAKDVIAEQQRAVKLDPFMPLYSTYQSFIYWWLGEPDLAIEAALESLAVDPGYAYGYYVLSQAYAAAGHFDQAIEAAEKAAGLNPRWTFAIGSIHALAGNTGKAVSVALELEIDAGPIETWGLAEIYATLGDADEAFRWLESCYEMRFSWYPWINWNPYFQPLKVDTRFDDHLNRLRLPVNASLASDYL